MRMNTGTDDFGIHGARQGAELVAAKGETGI
jgi:hypothetical protein